MGSLERRKREAQETRRRIMDAARDLFVEKGYDATSMRAIAKKIEYTPTAIYHHFESKDALIAELCARDFLELAARFNNAGRIDDPIERIRRSGEGYVEFALENPNHYRLMFMTPMAHDHELEGITHGDPSQDAYAFLRSSVVEAMEAGRFRPEFEDADQVAQILWGSLHGLVSLHIAKGHDDWVDMGDIRATIARAREVLMRGLLRDPDD